MTGRGEGEAPEAAGGLARHTPVLLSAALEALHPQSGESYIDCTFGAGGYSRAILASADCRLLAIDRDPSAAQAASVLAAEHPERFRFRISPFSALARIAGEEGFSPADGVIFDLGVSSMQLDEPERGFSFMRDGPLDMRMSGEGESAADVVNSYAESDLADIFYQLGEERRSRTIARAIVRRRAEKPFARTLDLANVIAAIVKGPRDGKHPATRSFQALRLYVNDELGELTAGLSAAERTLRPGGRLVAVSFHSLEDRIVKTFLAERSGGMGRPSRHLPEEADRRAPSFRLVNRRPIEPDAGEIAANPRARSARLRAAIRLDAPPWPGPPELSAPPARKKRQSRH